LVAFIRSEAQHEVEITQEFWLGVHEVTQKQFKAIMDSNPSFFSKDGEAKEGFKYADTSKPAGGKDNVAGQDTSDFPVENVSHREAVEFCRKLSNKEAKMGRKYRLPSEAEWEYACRGGARHYQTYHFGASITSKLANFDGSRPFGGANKSANLERTCKVGSYKKNGFGLYDMHGNVYEWCSDWFDKDYYSKCPGRDPAGPSKGSFRVLRGGAWDEDGEGCRSAKRMKGDPIVGLQDYGFRVAIVSAGK
jgi:formylglycine-generating enzyme required for sulfatase activity